VARALPNLRGRVVARLAAGQELALQPGANARQGWVVAQVNGATAYLPAQDVVQTAPAQTGPRLQPPTNIREHNRSVILARAQGPDRLKTLLTDVQARRSTLRLRVAATGAGSASHA
jgi:hypothetical protein